MEIELEFEKKIRLVHTFLFFFFRIFFFLFMSVLLWNTHRNFVFSVSRERLNRGNENFRQKVMKRLNGSCRRQGEASQKRHLFVSIDESRKINRSINKAPFGIHTMVYTIRRTEREGETLFTQKNWNLRSKINPKINFLMNFQMGLFYYRKKYTESIASRKYSQEYER